MARYNAPVVPHYQRPGDTPSGASFTSSPFYWRTGTMCSKGGLILPDLCGWGNNFRTHGSFSSQEPYTSRLESSLYTSLSVLSASQFRVKIL